MRGKPKFCANCGAAILAEQHDAAHPHCVACDTTHWINPRPVGVLLQPVRRDDDGRMGLVIGVRAIEPFIDGIALPAGFVEVDETAEAACARELEEELRLETPASWIRPLETVTIQDTMLIFCTTEHVLPNFTMEPFVPTIEAKSRGVIWGPTKLCFPTHTDVVEEWFKGR